MNIRFFKLPKHRTFNYKPIYYDPIKDEVDERKRLAEQELQGGEESYVPGAHIKGNMRRQIRSSRADMKANRLQRLLVRLLLLALIFCLLYFAQRFL